MLLRRSPFAEWVNIYYKPKETDEDTLHALLKGRGCAASQRIGGAEGASSVMNPFGAAGDTVQLHLNLPKADEIVSTKLPDKWKLSSPSALSKGHNFITIDTNPFAKNGKHSISVTLGSGETHSFSVELVSRI